MRKVTVGLVVISLLVVSLGMVGSAAALPGGTWVSGVTVANLDSTEATVSIAFYNQNGSVALNFDGGKIAGNAAKTWYLPSHITALASGFVGSAVVSADKQIAAIVNTQLPSGSNPGRLGASTGVGTPVATVYATQVEKNYYGWNSYCSVQNTGATAFSVNAFYYDSTGAQSGSARTQSIPAYSSFIFDQGVDSVLPNGVYSAKFVGDATHLLAVVCNFYNAGLDTTAGSDMQFHSYNGMGTGGTTLYLPRVVKDYYNYQSGLKIQNIGTEALTVTVSYNIGGGTYTQNSTSIGPGQSWGPYMGNAAQLPASMASVSGSGSAVVVVNNVTANKSIIATVNEDNRTNPAGRGVTYEAAVATEGASALVFPQVTARYYGYSSGIQVQKVEAGTATCTVDFSASGNVAAFQLTGVSLTDASPSYSLFAPAATGSRSTVANQDNYNGAVTVNCTGAKVIGIGNNSFRGDIDARYPNILGDTFSTYRGIGK
jgi:hypothetical protein